MSVVPKYRDGRLDMLRGLLLVIMAAVHVPTPLSHAFQEPFGFTSAAEGFIFLSAALGGLVFGRAYRQNGWAMMSRRVWNRTRQIYLVHIALVVPVALVAWWGASWLTPLANHFHDFLAHPWGSLSLLPLLLHQPPLFDILPLYIVMLGATPFILAAAVRYGWRRVLLVSALIWLTAQFKWSNPLFVDPSRLLPFRWGSFNLLAWQLLWVGGLALGDAACRKPIFRSEHRMPAVLLGAGLVLAGLLCRHGCWPQAWFPPDLFLWMDKWSLGPLRLMNFAAWVVFLVALNPRLPTAVFSPLALLGRNSLSVFSMHLPLVILATVIIEMTSPSAATQVVIGLLVVAALFPWAALQDYRKRQKLESMQGVIAAGA